MGSNDIHYFDPQALLGDRLGLTLYCLFVEAYLAGDYQAEARLYERFMSHFRGERAVHTVENFIQLIESVRRRGFDPYFPVYANPVDFGLMEGSHRCAIAIQLGIDRIPYHLRFTDDRTHPAVFSKVFRPGEMHYLVRKQDELIQRCPPDVALSCRLRRHMRENESSYQASFSSRTRMPVLRLYQDLEELGVRGKRPTRRRVETYGIAKYLHPSSDVLEVGCNVGFFLLAIAAHVASVVGFDVDANYGYVAREVARHLDVRNFVFEVSGISDFKTARAFDVVISTAVHGWAGLPFREYVDLLDGWTKAGGVILFESHEIDAERDWLDKRGLLTGRFDLLDSGFIDGVDTRVYESEIREYLILRKRLRT